MKSLKNIRENVSLFLWLITIVTGATGFSLIGGIDTVRSVFSSPEQIEQLRDTISHLELEIHNLQHYQENAWELSRLMTDDDDTLRWYFADIFGIPYDIDIRHTAEDIPLAFMYRFYMIHRVYYSSADDRYYIIVHDHFTGDNETYYLLKRDD